MKKFFAVSLLLSLAAPFNAQDYIESFTHNTDFRGAQRTMQYLPTPDGKIMCHNGKNLYTRALYGSHTLWRLETSDMPIFAAYHKRDNRNIHFTVSTATGEKRLDTVADCISEYQGGQRSYRLSDPAWGNGTLTLTVVASPTEESALWQVEAQGMPDDAVLTAVCCATVNVKLNRSGDMGADPANCFAPDPDLREARRCSMEIGGAKTAGYIKYADRDVTADNQRSLREEYDLAQTCRRDLAERIVIDTPDPYINTLAPSLCAAADGIWDGTTYQHGAVGWRMPLSGWRGAYTGDFLGWHDRARTHFDAYATSQVTEVAPVISHPTQDMKMSMARAEKRWGTQMYSNGYICRNPGRDDQMHHYDMNLCYIDELLWHLQWTGDIEYARQIWPVIKSSLQWEKRNYDPDNDGLYDAYCCIWASDALYYNSGAVTHSTAYNYRANTLAARIAQLIGEDPWPYQIEAQKILQALNTTLWMPGKGVWAEFRDRMGEQAMHTHPALWTVYHAIDSETASPMQAYTATRYVDECIPHIPVVATRMPEGTYATVSTTDWLPYAWSINNVAFAEVYHTALAYYQAGRPEEATNLLKSAMLDGMFMGNSPGNVGQVSFYDAARGESYRDFADPVGVLSRTLVQGLFGFSPNLLYGTVNFRPGFPSDWSHASISHPDFKLEYTSDTVNCRASLPAGINDNDVRRIDRYRLQMLLSQRLPTSLHVTLPARHAKAIAVSDGREIPTVCENAGTPYATITFDVPLSGQQPQNISVVWLGAPLSPSQLPVDRADTEVPAPLGIDLALTKAQHVYDPVNLSAYFNANVTDIFNNKYLSPRSPYTTLQIPVNGLGEWCHPNDTAYIHDGALRRAGGTFTTPQGIPFATPANGQNVLYVSQFDNYPTSARIPLSGKAHAVNLLMTGSTNHMQVYTDNADVTVTYTDGTADTLRLVPPYNWAPIEQDYYVDGKAFDIPTPAPLRMSLLGGVVSSNLGRDLNIEGVYGRRIPGGAAMILCLPLDPKKELASLTLTAHANEVVVGLIAATCVRPAQKQP